MIKCRKSTSFSEKHDEKSNMLSLILSNSHNSYNLLRTYYMLGILCYIFSVLLQKQLMRLKHVFFQMKILRFWGRVWVTCVK